MRQDFWRKLSGWLLIMLIACVSASAAVISVVDQQNFVSSNDSQGGVVFGQSFTPALSSIDAFEVVIGDMSATIGVQILDGLVGFDGLDGNVLGTSNPVSVTTNGRQPIQFDFTGGVSLKPGQTYVAKIYATSGVIPPGVEGISITTNNNYAGGQLLEAGSSTTTSYLLNYDAVFQEGLTATPEPSTFYSLVVAVLVFGSLKMLKSRR